MTADEWLTCTRPDPMLKVIADKASGRKLRLLACGFCRLVWDQHTDRRSRAAVEAAERYADGLLGEDEFRTLAAAAGEVARAIEEDLDAAVDVYTDRLFSAAAAASFAVQGNPAAGAGYALEWDCRAAEAAAAPGGRRHARQQFEAAACDLIREIIGPLSHPLVLMPAPMLRDYGGPAAAFRARISDTARRVAEGIADELAFDRLPILADALEDAGLDDRPLLDHLRHGPAHARGCWALDLVLGRA
jgi:hypothetical protein